MWILTRWRTFRGSIRRDFFANDQLLTNRQKMKHKTASERQRNLERTYGSRNCRNSNKLSNYLYWTFRRLHFFLCYYDAEAELDLDDLLTNPFNSQPPSLDQLQKLTGFQKNWLAFFYRNFKQLCSNGRMHKYQLRAIFRIIFKGAADYEFCDRIFNAITGNRSTKQITFEDLIMCLYDLTQSFRTDLDKSQVCPSTTTAQFTFSLMQPDSQGRVDEEAFLSYVKCIFDLNASLSGCSLSNDFGMANSGSSSTDKNARRATIYPWLANLARQQFAMLDADKDGYIRLEDIQALFDQSTCIYESLVLKTESEFETPKSSESTSSS
ncbi:hypothetical protein M3Y97_00554800 [Aphelenchoides bicaudatus]|nr:hypothetical protein M3Y97_00554800 [Aphelenchoides bicaudatus]